jgi:hypothetical protein
MKTHFCFFGRSLVIFGCLGATFSVVGCSSTPKNPAIKLNEVLDQVSYALKRAYDLNGDKGPRVTSVQIEMQVLTVIDTKASLPTVSIVPDLESTSKQGHYVSLSFIPQMDKWTAAKDPVLAGKKETGLTLAIRSVFESLNEAHDNFSFSRGSVQLQCTIEEEISSSVKIPILVPIQLGTDNSKQVIHTLTLNFEPQAASGDSSTTSDKGASSNSTALKSKDSEEKSGSKK